MFKGSNRGVLRGKLAGKKKCNSVDVHIDRWTMDNRAFRIKQYRNKANASFYSNKYKPWCAPRRKLHRLGDQWCPALLSVFSGLACSRCLREMRVKHLRSSSIVAFWSLFVAYVNDSRVLILASFVKPKNAKKNSKIMVAPCRSLSVALGGDCGVKNLSGRSWLLVVGRSWSLHVLDERER
jgi:hypothetical protein